MTIKILAAAALILMSPAGRAAPPPAVPVLLELFTSEGCSSCPSADTLLEALVREQGVEGAVIVPLGLHVDYWDRLGWRDPFSSPAFTARQEAYAATLGDRGPYTPQMVVDGVAAFVGSDRAAALRAIKAASERPHLAVDVTARTVAGGVRIAVDLPAAPAGAEPVQVLAAITESGLTSAVRRGENSGRTLQHIGVARKVQTLGVLEADAYVAEGQWRLERGWDPGKLQVVVWLQGAKTRRVYGTATAPLVR